MLVFRVDPKDPPYIAGEFEPLKFAHVFHPGLGLPIASDCSQKKHEKNCSVA